MAIDIYHPKHHRGNVEIDGRTYRSDSLGNALEPDEFRSRCKELCSAVWGTEHRVSIDEAIERLRSEATAVAQHLDKKEAIGLGIELSRLMWSEARR